MRITRAKMNEREYGAYLMGLEKGLEVGVERMRYLGAQVPLLRMERDLETTRRVKAEVLARIAERK